MEVKKACPECFLGSICSPGEYWLVSKLKSHVEEVRALEETLSEEMNKSLNVPHRESLNEHSCVAVASPIVRGAWHRGQIEKQISQDSYQVFLIDSGLSLEVAPQNLQIITDPKYTQVEPLAFKFHLYGLVPIVNLDETCRKQVIESWNDEAVKYAQSLFSQRLHIYVKKVHIIERNVFGELFIINASHETLSLRKLLCAKGFSVYSEAYYQKKVMGPISHAPQAIPEATRNNHSSEFERRMQRVEEWQSSNFQNNARRSEGSRVESLPDPAPETSARTQLEDVGKPLDDDANKRDADDASPPPPPPLGSESLRRKCSDSIASPRNCENNANSPASSKENQFGKSLASASLEKFAFANTWSRTKGLPKIDSHAPQPSNRNSDFDVFTFFNDVAVSPVDTFRSSNLSESIVLNLEMQGHFKELSGIQRWAIPAIQRGCNVAMIGSSKTGKTLSYVVSVLDLVQNKLHLEELPEGNGPFVVILCSSSRSCEFVYNACKLLLPQSATDPRIKIIIAHGGGCEKNTWVDLTNGCDILISTPHCMVRLLRHAGITNLARLKVLVLDDVHVITREPFLSQVKIVLHRARNSCKSDDYQKVFAGENWTPEVASVYGSFAKNHVLLFGCHLEAAVFAKLKPFVYFTDADSKMRVLMDVASDAIDKGKVLMVCGEASEALNLKRALEERGHAPLIAHGNLLRQDITSVRASWTRSARPPVLVCTDDVIPELNIDDVENLVHYSLPHKSKTNFGNRFSTLAKNYKRSVSKEKGESSLGVIIMIDDQNHTELPHIVDFVLRLGGKVPARILATCEEIKWRVETAKKTVPMCANVMEFGECKNVVGCNDRHALSRDADAGKRMLAGMIKFEVLYVHDVCHLSVRVIEHLGDDNRKSIADDVRGEICDGMREHYSDDENKKCASSLEPNEMYAVEVEDMDGTHFYRAAVVERKKMNRMKEAAEAVVKLIDRGYYVTTSVAKLYELPSELKSHPPQSTDVYLCNLLPKDFDSRWSTPAVLLAERIFVRDRNENQFWIGRIVLSLDNSLHLHPVKLCRRLETLNTHSIDLCPHKKLISCNVALKNENHLQRLRELCARAGIDVPRHEDAEDDGEKNGREPEWAFFHDDFMRIHLVCATSASVVFVRMAKFEEQLHRLEMECAKEAEATTKKAREKRKLRPGNYCLASYEDDWYRGRIESAESGRHVVYFIDHGYLRDVDEVLPISEKLVARLPAQAIECSLTGVRGGEERSDEVVAGIRKFSRENERGLYARVVDKRDKADVTGGRKYEVNVVNRTGASMSRELVNAGLLEGGGGDLPEDLTFVPSDEDEDLSGETSSSRGGEEEEEEEEGEDCDDSSCVLDPEAFTDENAELFVKELLHVMFPNTFPEWRKEEDRIDDVTRARDRDVSVTDGGSLTASAVASASTCCLTPRVVWSQDHSAIRLKIMLTNVNKFKLDCSSTHVVFRCKLEDKVYAVSLRLFGAVNPRMSSATAKTFHVHVHLVKLCSSNWPRLQRDRRKHRWINVDVENRVEAERSYSEEICVKAMERIGSGVVRTAEEYGEVDFVPSTDSEGDADSDDEWSGKDEFAF